MRYRVLILAAAALVLRAQDPPGAPPERGVARLSIVNGEVSVRRGDSGDWVAAVVNAPLMVEDRVATGPGARAEVQFDAGNMIRLGANAEVRLAQLDYSHYELQVAHGTVMYRALREGRARVELDTPPVSVRPSSVGAYRIYVKEGGTTEITVRAGTAEIYTPKGGEQLQAGQTMLARGNPADPEFQITPGIAYDEWDRWNEQRDRELQSSASSRYVPQGVYGAEDLDKNGRWVNDPSYGWVWNPGVGADWVPYQNGEWVWEDWYGWTWVSYDPWGWAPYHYGRWFYAAPYGWCWYPGGYGPHYWSPALVAFFGFGGPGIGAGFGFGNIGWVALAPFERSYPWWGRGFYDFNRNINITNVNISSVYRNARVTNAIAGVRATDFNQGRFGGIARYSGSQIHDAGLVRGQLPVAPGAANLRYASRAPGFVPRGASNMRFFSRNTAAAPVQRVPFAEQQRGMQQLSRQATTVAAPAPRSIAAGGAVGGATGSSGAWRAVAPPPAQAAYRGANGRVPERVTGWQRFGLPLQNAPRSSYAVGSAAYRSRPAPSSIRVAPQVVRERSVPQGETHSAPASHGGGTPSHGGGHGGGHGR